MTPIEAWRTIRSYLTRIPEPEIREKYLAFHDRHEDLACKMPASVGHHHAWPGGYSIHICEVMGNMRPMGSLARPKQIGFTRSQAIRAPYIHDLDKLLERYEVDSEEPSYAQIKLLKDKRLYIEGMTKKMAHAVLDADARGEVLDLARLPRHMYSKLAKDCDDSGIVTFLCWENDLPIDRTILHAVAVHHGGFSNLARGSSRMKMEPLGVYLHAADLISANVQLGNVEITLEESTPVTDTQYNGLNCSVCHKPQYTTPSGDTCENGHAPGYNPDDQIPGLPPTPDVAPKTMSKEQADQLCKLIPQPPATPPPPPPRHPVEAPAHVGHMPLPGRSTVNQPQLPFAPPQHPQG